MTPKKGRSRSSVSVCSALALMFLMSSIGCSDRNIAPASRLASGRVTLSWTNAPGAAAYNVYFSRSPGVTKATGFKIPQATSPLTITDLEPGKTYYFILSVVDESGASRESDEKSYSAKEGVGQIDFNDPTLKPRAAEERAAVLEAPAGELTLTWDSVPGAASYNVYWSDAPGAAKQNARKVPSVTNSIVIKGLERGKTYYFVVTTLSDSGESGESEQVSVRIK